jgi:DNA-binding NarL/FixJ family response regulator
MPFRILLADDHVLLRQGLRSLLETEGLQVVGEAGDGRSAVKLVNKLRPDAVIIDISMPGLNGIEATRQIYREWPQVRVIVLSMHSDSRFVLEAFRAGAAGYLLKDAAFEEISVAAEAVLKGRSYVSPGIAEVVVRQSVGQWSSEAESEKSMISRREREVIQLLAEGKSTKEIAGSLYVSVKTIETHRRQIMGRLRLQSIADLTKYAIREGFTSP